MRSYQSSRTFRIVSDQVMIDPCAPLMMSRATYFVVDAPSLRRSIDACIDLVGAGRDTWSWMETGSGVVLGSLELTDPYLVLHIMDAERMERGRNYLESMTGASIRHLATERVDVAPLMRRAAEVLVQHPELIGKP